MALTTTGRVIASVTGTVYTNYFYNFRMFFTPRFVFWFGCGVSIRLCKLKPRLTLARGRFSLFFLCATHSLFVFSRSVSPGLSLPFHSLPFPISLTFLSVFFSFFLVSWTYLFHCPLRLSYLFGQGNTLFTLK